MGWDGIEEVANWLCVVDRSPADISCCTHTHLSWPVL